MIPGLFELQRIGSGGFASVFRARSARLGEIALKVAHRPGDRRLSREADILRRLGPPATPRFFDLGATTDGRPWLAMSIVDHDSLDQRIGRAHFARIAGGGFDIADIARLFAAVCDALHAFHQAGFAHRDLKPGNILLRADGSAALIDFGLSRSLARAAPASEHAVSITMRDERVGTHYYMAPEQWTGSGKIDVRTDIYALGVVAFELLTGRPPFTGDTGVVRLAHLLGYRPWPSKLVALPAGLDTVVRQALHKRPERRFASVESMARAFARALETPVRGGSGPSASSAASAASVLAASARSRRPRDRRHVGFLVLEVVAGASRVSHFARAHGAVVVAERAPRYVLGFVGETSARLAAQAALDAARAAWREQVVQDGVRLVHAATCPVRRRGRAAMPITPDVRWLRELPAPRHEGAISLTDAALALLGEAAVEPATAGLHRVADRNVERSGGPAVSARDAADELEVRGDARAVLGRALADAASSFAERRPTLRVIEAETGLGKTRIVRAVERASWVSAEGSALAVVTLSVNASSTADARRHGLCRLLLEWAFGRVCRDGEELARAWERLGVEPDRAQQRAAAAALGVNSEPAVDLGGNRPVGDRPVGDGPVGDGQVDDWRALSAAVALALRAAARQGPRLLLIDDAHRAEPQALGAIERATLPEAGVPLCAIIAGRPPLVAERRRYSDRAQDVPVDSLTPLSVEDGRALLRELLRPAESIPDPVLDSLHQAARGVPGFMVEIARSLRERGAIRPDPQGRGGYVLSLQGASGASAGVSGDLDSALDRRLAVQTLESLPAHWTEFVQLCACLGELGAALDADEAGAVQDRLYRRGVQGVAQVDAGAGLGYLAHCDVLVPVGAHYAFRAPFVRPALVALTGADTRRRLHRAIFEHLRARDDSDLARRAHHAARCGEAQAAAALFVRAADDARMEHRSVAVEAYLSRALALVEPDAECAPSDQVTDLQLAAYAGRGRARYRLKQPDAAVADFQAARALATSLGRALDYVALLFEEGKALDWCERWGEAEARTEEAAGLIETLSEADRERFATELALARGRSHYRAARYPEALSALAGLPEAADYETRMIALLLIAPTLGYLERYRESERCFEDVIALCRDAGDDFHLTAAYINRQTLWLITGNLERTRADMEVAVTASRRLGNAQLERYATFNLAELLYWCADYERAAELARRARDLYLRFLASYDDPDDHLLLARIYVSDGKERAARASLAWVDEHCARDDLMPATRAQIDTVRLAVRALHENRLAVDAWRALVERHEGEGRIEALTVAAELAVRLGQGEVARRFCERAREAAVHSPRWHTRHELLAARVLRSVPGAGAT